MEQILCVIVDDEIRAINYLESIVLQIPQLKLIGTFKNPIEAKDYLLTHPEVYLAFVDISMSGLSGLELAKLIPDKKVVFTTGHEEFALESWRYKNVLGYLTKPISFKDISEIIEKIYPLYNAENIALRFGSDNTLTYRIEDKIVKIPYDRILYLESTRNYTNVLLEEGSRFAPIALWELERGLPKSIFVRVGKSTIANKNKVTGFSENFKEVEFMGGLKCKSSKHYIQNADF
ncbi:LytTR family DNA-binding domain-containing protein [Sphingobacterium siyangense]|uniref:LytR/AlgR family response regulator transcription factor n=1 Tax=Sphingobacterium siyangense TaxID=459529 RepID=UPI002FDCDDEC